MLALRSAGVFVFVYPNTKGLKFEVVVADYNTFLSVFISVYHLTQVSQAEEL
nr:MAG TPA: hypothetical protein [Caudoviricetes sp.]